MDSSFEATLLATSTALQLQRKRGRRHLLSSIFKGFKRGKRGKKGSHRRDSSPAALVQSIVRMIGAVTDTQEPVGESQRAVVDWARDAITYFANARNERARQGVQTMQTPLQPFGETSSSFPSFPSFPSSSSRLPPEHVAEVLGLVDRLTNLLQ